jgi:hypothetical protein
MNRIATHKSWLVLASVLVTFALAACTNPDRGQAPREQLGTAESPYVGQNGALTVSAAGTQLNQYAILGANVAAGATSLTVTNVANLTSPTFGAIAGGDLVMIIQMQGATIDTTNVPAYGTISALGNAGRYELVGVTGVAGNTLNLACGLKYSYSTAGNVQVIRVPQFTTLTIAAAGTITAPAWNGQIGGVVAIHAQNTVQLDGRIDVSALGFRGGAPDNVTTAEGTDVALYVGNSDANGAEKGESIAGYQAAYDALTGRYARGAPANGGGGGNAHNAGGGGGSNGRRGGTWTGQGVMLGSVAGAAAWALDPGDIAAGGLTNSDGGGRGGYTYSQNDQNALTVGPGNAAWAGNNRREHGGLGGHPLDNDPTGRLFFGGGGGAGDGNNNGAGRGGNGGGLVFLMSGTITGAGQILANGEVGALANTNPGDAPGGGGGGGTVVVGATTLSGITIHADGGVGGNQTNSNGTETEGPGGGGGGGYVAVSGGAVTATAAGAIGGTTNRPALTEFPSNGATAGNTGQTNGVAQNLAYCVDSTAPDTTITSGPATHTQQTTAAFTFTSNDATATFQCSLDGGAWAACTTPYALAAVTEAQHTLSVRARDLSGNVDATPATYTWTVDRTAPTATISTGPANPTNQTSAAFTLTSNESNVSYECSLDGAAYAVCTASPSFTVGAGAHSLVVRATDQAGNVSAPSAAWDFTVDTTAPTATIATGPSSPTRQTSAAFTLTSNESPVSFQCSLDGAAYLACPASPTFTVAEGAHSLVVEATDQAGNVSLPSAAWNFTVDTTAPTATIATGPSSPTNQTSAAFTLTSNEANVTYQCSLDGAGYLACPANPSFTVAQGAHSLVVQATDQAGNVSAPSAAWNFTVDTTAPTATIAAGPADPTNQTSATFTLSSNESPVAFQCSLDGGALVACPANPTFTVGEGIHSLVVVATDQAGNQSAPSLPWNWTVDTTMPTASIATGPASPTNQTAAAFTLTSNESPVAFQCSLDGGVYVACSASPTFTVAEGAHSLVVEATDQAGNVSPPSAAWNWTVDTTAPTATIVTGPPSHTNQTSAAFTFSSNENPVTYQCSLDGGAFLACTASPTFTVADGPHSLVVRATDQAGNVGSPSPAWNFTVDTVPPTASIVTGPADPTNQTSATFTLTSDESPVTFECSLDGDVYAACTANPTFTVAGGPHTLVVRATDQAGNVSAPSSAWPWTVDTTAPTATIVTGPASPTGQTTAAFTLSSNESPVTFQCSLDGASFAACTSSPTFTVTDGNHSLVVRATDQAGNVSPPSAAWNWTVDTTIPTATIVTGPATFTSQTSAAFTLSSSKSPVTFECSLDGATFAACTANPTFAVAEGAHSLVVRATDQTNHVSAPSQPWNWTVDTTPPTATIVTGPATPTNQTSAAFTLTSNESPVTFQCSLDGAAFAPCTASPTFTVADGNHSLVVRAIDQAGNVGAPSPAWNFVVDSTGPTATIVTGPPTTTTQTSASFTLSSNENPVSYECSLDGAAFAACSANPSFTVAIGVHSLVVRAKDGAGNTGPSSAAYDWAVVPDVPSSGGAGGMGGAAGAAGFAGAAGAAGEAGTAGSAGQAGAAGTAGSAGSPAGGTATGGTATGGAATGGAATGGTATGGTATGGAATGGSDNGGTPTGGTTTGGAATGGTATGGVATGGTATGGVATGGVATAGSAGAGGETAGAAGNAGAAGETGGSVLLATGGNPPEPGPATRIDALGSGLCAQSTPRPGRGSFWALIILGGVILRHSRRR